MNYKDLAIIGMSGVFPKADDLNEFYQNLTNGDDSVRGVPEERLKSCGYVPLSEYGVCGYLDRVDRFDHRFFKISFREACAFNPQQRLLLQMVCHAIEHAGYSLEQFRGSKTSLYLTAASSNRYNDLFKHQTTELTLNNTVGMIAGKLAYYLDLRGPAVMVDSICSSSLLAVHEACKSILVGEAEVAIAGGIHILHDPPPADLKDVPMAARDGRCKTFSANADGTGVGEGGGVVVLKPLKKALRDRDCIYAVIKGGAANQDGGQGIGSAAPSPEGQTDVYLQAWKNADIDPATLSYIEAHGTGTKLGDPIEIQGLSDAFKKYTDQKQFCAIGSVKTNLGHLNTAAGIASLIKVVLSLRYKKRFPSLHFDTPNPLIDFENSPVFVNHQLNDWKPQDNRERRAGVSTFSMTGTNIHLVLEEAPPKDKDDVETPGQEDGEELLFTFSAKSSQSLKNYVENTLHYLPSARAPLADISFTFNQGRGDYAFRYAAAARDKQQLTEQLKAFIGDYEKDKDSEGKNIGFTVERPVFLLLSGDISIEAHLFDDLSRKYAPFKQTVETCFNILPDNLSNDYVKIFIFQYALYCLARSMGLTASNVIGTGVSNLAVAVITERTSLKEGLEKAAAFKEVKPFDHHKFNNVITAMLKNENPVFVEIGSQGILGRAIGEYIQEEDLLSFPGGVSLSPLETISLLYQKGVNIKWESFYESQERHRVEVPVYPFEKTACWVPQSRRRKMAGPQSQIEAESEEEEVVPECVLLDSEVATETEKRLAKLWGEVLGVEELQRNSNYFELGGDSIIEVQLINRIQEHFGVEVDFERIFEKETLKEQAAFIDFMKPSSVIPVTKVERTESLPLSSAQESQYFLYRMNKDSAHYNMCIPLRLKGPLNREALAQAMNELVKRHEILRTVYYLNDGKPVQKINPHREVDFPVLDISSEPDKEERVQQLMDSESLKPFDLSKDLGIRILTIYMGVNDHVIFLNLHHITADAWSVGIILKEISALYNAFLNNKEADLPELDIQYADYASWQQNRLNDAKVYDKLLSYWKKKLSGPLPPLFLPADGPRPEVPSFKGFTHYFTYSNELSQMIREFSKQEQATVFHTFLAAFKTLLFRYTQVEDIIIGTPFAGRGKKELEHVIGFFANMLVLRTKLQGDLSFRDLLKQVRLEAMSAFAHQEMPFDKLVAEFESERKTSQNPFFQVILAYQNVPTASQSLLDLKDLETLSSGLEGKTVRFDLEFGLFDTGKVIRGMLVYATDLFNHERIVRMANHFQVLLESVLANPDQTLAELPIMGEEEKDQLVRIKREEGMEEGEI
jgi:3-oxoacyl-(acyl-carrier-protein) synthase/acyl carrier protein